MANNMPSSDDEDMTETRFSNFTPVIQTQRVMLDVSEIPVALFPSANDDNSVDGSDANNLRGQLFQNGTMELGNNAHEVTLPSVPAESNLPSIDDLLAEIARTPNDNDANDLEADATTMMGQQKKRHRFSYAKKYFYGSSVLYFQLDPTLPQPEQLPELLGQIIGCPNKKNNNQYHVKWLRPKDSGNWPVNLTPHLRSYFPKDMLQLQLAFLIGECPVNLNLVNAPSDPTLPVPLPQPLPRQQTIERPPPVIQTPAPTQRATFAAVYTAGSVSGLSSLGQSQASQQERTRANSTSTPRNRSSRIRVAGEEQDSDEDNTDDEDDYDVDFSWRIKNTSTNNSHLGCHACKSCTRRQEKKYGMFEVLRRRCQ